MTIKTKCVEPGETEMNPTHQINLTALWWSFCEGRRTVVVFGGCTCTCESEIMGTEPRVKSAGRPRDVNPTEQIKAKGYFCPR